MRRIASRSRTCLATAAGVLCIFALGNAQTGREIAEKAFPSVVLLVMEDADGEPISWGSGFFVRENVVATNMHVIEGASAGYAKLVGGDTEYRIAGVFAIDRDQDLACLKLTDADAPALPLGDSGQVAAGDEVYVVGNPLGLEGTVSRGIVSGVRKFGEYTWLQIDAAISEGSSGGPVLNGRGGVIGVAAAYLSGGQNLNFAIPSSYLVSLLRDMTPLKSICTIEEPPPEEPPVEEEEVPAPESAALRVLREAEASLYALQRLKAVDIVVEGLRPEGSRRTGLTEEQLKSTLTAALLRSDTVQVVTDEEQYTRTGTMYLNVQLMPLEPPWGAVYTLDLQVQQPALVLRRNGPWLWKSTAVTWDRGGFIGIGSDNEVAPHVKDSIRDLVDMFTVDYFRENPSAARY